MLSEKKILNEAKNHNPHKATCQNDDIYTFQMILQFVVKAFEEESSLPEVYDRYKLLLHKNDLNIVIDTMTVTKICPNCYTSLN